MGYETISLGANITTDGNKAEVLMKSNLMQIEITGTLGGAIVEFETTYDNVTWSKYLINNAASQQTVEGILYNIPVFSHAAKIRAVVASVGGSTNFNIIAHINTNLLTNLF